MAIKLKRGLEATIPTLEVGEPGFTTDSKKLFVGSDTGNIEIGGNGGGGGNVSEDDINDTVKDAIVNNDRELRDTVKNVVNEVGTTNTWQTDANVDSKITAHDEDPNAHSSLITMVSTAIGNLESDVGGIAEQVVLMLNNGVYTSLSPGYLQVLNSDYATNIGSDGASYDYADLQAFLNNVYTKSETYNRSETYSRAQVNSLVAGGEGGSIEIEALTLVETTWSTLKDKRDAGELAPGAQYRITDYVTTTAQVDTQSAGHQFDIIVTADDVNKLNENARACLHGGDTYFADSKLEAWQLKYCLDNDTSRFSWAKSANGKGVIYKMIDEFNNDVPYDFKNIQFTKEGVWRYTFGDDLVGTSHSNKISEYIYINKATLNANTFGANCYNNTFGNGCYNNTFSSNCYSNIFGDGCYDNDFGTNCYSNTFGYRCYSNLLHTNNYLYTLGNGCGSNIFGGYSYNNTFGNACTSNYLGNYSKFNTFGDDCRDLQISRHNSPGMAYIHVENGTKGVSNQNRFDVYDPDILDKNCQVTIKKSTSGKYLMLWATDAGTMTGKIKDDNTISTTWEDIV